MEGSEAASGTGSREGSTRQTRSVTGSFGKARSIASSNAGDGSTKSRSGGVRCDTGNGAGSIAGSGAGSGTGSIAGSGVSGDGRSRSEAGAVNLSLFRVLLKP